MFGLRRKGEEGFSEEEIKEMAARMAFGEAEHFPAPGEPILGQLDNTLLNMIVYYSNPIKEGGLGYKELRKYLFLLSHLNRTSYLDRTEALQAYSIIDLYLTIDEARFVGNAEVLDLLGLIRFTAFMIIFGDAEHGKRQRYLQTQVREVRVSTPRSEGKRWWML